MTRLCEQLDGIPLAIELAAARLRLLSLDQMVARLGDRFRLLAGGGRTAPLRHQSLQALMDWSYDLLSPPERVLLCQLSVFAGGFTLEAAEEVCAGDGIDSAQILDLLAQLERESLVEVDRQDGATRYRLLETVRQYAGDRLAEMGDPAAVRDRHRAYFLALSRQASPHLLGAGQRAWLDRLEAERDNLRAALEWALSQGEAEAVLGVAEALYWFVYKRGDWSEGRHWLQAALAKSPAAPAVDRARTLSLVGALAWLKGEYSTAARHCIEGLMLSRTQGDLRGAAYALAVLGNLAVLRNDRRAQALTEECLTSARQTGDRWLIGAALVNKGLYAIQRSAYAEAVKFLEEGIALLREVQDEDGIALALSHLGRVALIQGAYERATALLEESHEVSRRFRNRRSAAIALLNLGILARDQGDRERARGLFEESLAIFRELQSKSGIAPVLAHLGRLEHFEGHDDRAAALLEESLGLYRELGSGLGIAFSLSYLGALARARGDVERARALLAEGLALARESGARHTIAAILQEVGALAAEQGKFLPAARLLGAAEALREALGAPLSPAEGAGYDRHIAQVREVLGPEEFSAAWAQGRAMSVDQAIASGLDV